MLRLERGATVTFDFCKPPRPTLSSIADSHRSYMAAKPADYVGALKDLSSWTVPPKLKYLPEETPVPKRLYPCTQGEELPLNIPFERYKTFIVVLDKPDFIEGTGVLFLLTDGGHGLKRLQSESNMFYEEPDLAETLVWRSSDMDGVVRRLAMQAGIPRWQNEDWVEDADKDAANNDGAEEGDAQQ
ncbi:hypothetical protein LTR85_008104 [Meristemomyces frigidus]|nr:hypothetical protein LTR85_008104 [Meristemomyces frigidus]